MVIDIPRLGGCDGTDASAPARDEYILSHEPDSGLDELRVVTPDAAHPLPELRRWAADLAAVRRVLGRRF